jgi:hypothetical protein
MYHLPEKLQYFIDPYGVIDKYTSCRINRTKSHLEPLSLSSVYLFLFEEPLEGGHDVLVDVKAQTSIIAHPMIKTGMDTPNSSTSFKFCNEAFFNI